MGPKPNRDPLIIRIPIRAKKLIPPPPAASTEEAMVQKLRESLLDKLSVPLSPGLKCRIGRCLQELAPSFHTPDHPPYALMISKAIEELDDQMGSSENSISEFILREYKDLPLAHKFMLTHYLGKLCENGEILCVDGERYVLPGNEKMEKKARRSKGRRRRASQNGGDENRCRGQEFAVKEPRGGGEIEQIEENGKGRPRKRIQTVQVVEERRAIEVAEQNRAMVVYEGENHDKELSAEVVENGSQAPRQGVEIQDDLMDLLDWNHVAPTMFQLENSESVGQVMAEGTWTQRTWWLDTSCAIVVEKVKQEIAERLRCLCRSPSFAMEAKQLREDITKMKLDMQELASEDRKVHLDVDLLKKTYTQLLEKTKKALERLIRTSHSGAEVENVVEELSQSQEHSNGWTEIAKPLPATAEILQDRATTSLDAPLYMEYTVQHQQTRILKPGASMDLSLVEAESTSLNVYMDLAFKSTTREQLSQEEQQPKLCDAAGVNIFQVEQERQLELPNPQKPVQIELMSLELSSKSKEEMLQQGGGRQSVVEHQSRKPQEYLDSERPHIVTSRNTTQVLPPVEEHGRRKQKQRKLQCGQVGRRGREPSKPDKVISSGSLSPQQNEQEQLCYQGQKVVDLSTYPRLRLALNTRHAKQQQSQTDGTRTIVVCLPHKNQHPGGQQKQNKGRWRLPKLEMGASTDTLGELLQLPKPEQYKPPKL